MDEFTTWLDLMKVIEPNTVDKVLELSKDTKDATNNLIYEYNRQFKNMPRENIKRGMHESVPGLDQKYIEINGEIMAVPSDDPGGGYNEKLRKAIDPNEEAFDKSQWLYMLKKLNRTA